MQTATRLGEPFTITLIFCTFALKRRRDRRCECEMLFPNPGVFLQMSQTDAIRRQRVPQPASVPHILPGQAPFSVAGKQYNRTYVRL